MRIVLSIDAEAVGGPRAVDKIARGYSRAARLHALILERRGAPPARLRMRRDGAGNARLDVDVDINAVGGPVNVARVCRAYLCGLIEHNRILIRRGAVPGLYEAFEAGRLIFQPEPWAGKYEEFACAKTCADRGWLDCDDAVPWRCAEIIEHDRRLAAPKIYWRMRDERGRLFVDPRLWRHAASIGYHAEARIACRCHQSLTCDSSEVEDVSAFIGMGRRGLRDQDRPRREAS